MTTTYRTDFYVWTQRQADLLRNEDYADLDLPNLIEEIESLGANARRELKSRLRTILTHMLKLLCEPTAQPSAQWRGTIRTQRNDLADLLDENFTLQSTVGDFIEAAYAKAVEDAADGTKCDAVDFPATCPWTTVQILDKAFLPAYR